MSLPSKAIAARGRLEEAQQRRGRAWTCRSPIRRRAPSVSPRAIVEATRPSTALHARRRTAAEQPAPRSAKCFVRLSRDQRADASRRDLPGSGSARGDAARAARAAAPRRGTGRCTAGQRSANWQPVGSSRARHHARDLPTASPRRVGASSCSAPSASRPRCRDGAAREQRLGVARARRSRPAYMTTTSSQVSATTPRSCVMSRMPCRARAAARSSSSRICAWIVTSSAVVGSSAISSVGLAGERHRDHHALAHAAGELVRIAVDALARATGCRRARSISTAPRRASALRLAAGAAAPPRRSARRR